MNSLCSRGLNNNTLVHEIDIHKGSQWALHNGTVVCACVLKGPLCMRFKFENVLFAFE